VAIGEKADAAWKRIDSRDSAVSDQKTKAARVIANQRAALAQSGLLYREMRRQFCKLCDIPDDDRVTFSDLPPYTAPTVSLDSCLAWAQKKRNDLQATRQEAELLAQSVKLARLGYLPKPTLSFGYNQDQNNVDQPTQQGGYALLGLSVPIWTAGEISAQIRKLKAQEQGVHIEVTAMETRIVKSVTTAYLEWQRAIQTYNDAKSDPKFEETVKTTELKYKQGAISAIDYELSRVSQADHEGDLLRKKWNCTETEADLLEAVEATPVELASGLVLTPEPGQP
jgi:outer membrane protein TolC